ncbi:hypothetical protein N8256_00365 [Pelagibacteraceae bacterium]|nr:hypothetical protein [Pelagibacteraceae bacterium]
MKKILGLLIFISFISFSYGYLVSRNKIFPYSILKDLFGTKNGSYIIIEETKKKSWYKKMQIEVINKIVIINKYNNGYYIFNNRTYTDNSDNNELVGKTLIQIARHRSEDLKIILEEGAFIYRVLCDANNNEKYIDWLDAGYNVEINGFYCVHKKVIKKYFTHGVLTLQAGGPVSADPIFVDENKSDNVIVYK